MNPIYYKENEQANNGVANINMRYPELSQQCWLSPMLCNVIFSGITAEAVLPPYNEDLFDINVDNCLSDFNKSMETSDYQNMCPWPMVQR